MYFTVAGMSNVVRLEHPQKALCKSVSTGEVMVTLVRLVFWSKASLPIFVILPPIVTFVRAVFSSENQPGMFVILPPSSISLAAVTIFLFASANVMSRPI